MQITQNDTVASFVTGNPAAVAILERHHIDYCCGGERPLEQACKGAGLSLEQLESELSATPAGVEERNWADAPLADLADHIVSRHHRYLRSTMPEVQEKLTKLRVAHATAHGELLSSLSRSFEGLAAELTQHMVKEEIILFPLIGRMEQASAQGGPPPMAPGGTIQNPIRMMEHEHDSAGQALRTMRQLTSNYALPDDGCATFAALYHQLGELESDLHMHIHLENNILFPRAAEMESQL
jgi:regulator of cell morphogenesis and NO signaling